MVTEDVACSVRLVIAIAVMVSASVSDVRTRHVSDRHWLVLCVSGVSAEAVVLSHSDPYAAVAYAVGASLLTVYMLSDVHFAILVPAVLSLVVPVLSGSPVGSQVALVPVLCLSFLALYMSKVVVGGADIKFLMSVAMVFPSASVHPCLPLPLSEPGPVMMVPAVATLLMALALTLSGSIVMLLRNVRDGHVGRGSLSSYVIDVSDADPVFVWPVEDLRHPGVPHRGSPDDAADILEYCRENGVERIRVTPAVPFILPLTAAFVATVLLGDPLSHLDVYAVPAR